MFALRRGVLLSVILAAFLPQTLQAQAPSFGAQSRITDDTRFFKKSTVESMTRALEAAERENSVPVVIDVVETLQGKPIEEAALNAARVSGGGGLFVFIAHRDKKIHVLARRQFENRFPPEARSEITTSFANGFRSGNPDEGLEKGGGDHHRDSQGVRIEVAAACGS